MLAPCIIVLSTSKKAATDGSAGVASAVSTSAAAAAASPARAERCWRFSTLRLFSGVTLAAYRCKPVGRLASKPGSPLGSSLACGIIAPMPTTHDVSSLVAEAAADRPDALAVVEAAGRSVTWAALEDEVARIATGLGAAGLVAGQRVLLALGNRIEFVTAYLGVLRAQVVAVPVNPRATSGELARMIADSGLPAGARRPRDDRDRAHGRRPRARGPRRRDRRAGRRPGRPLPRAAGLRRGCGADRERAGLRRPARRCARCRVPPLPDPEKLACLLYTSGTSGRPRAAMLTHRALIANIDQAAQVRAADDPRRRRGARRTPALPRLRAQRRARQRAAAARQAGARRPLRPAGDARPDRRRGDQRAAGRAAGLRLLAPAGAPARAARPGATDALGLGAPCRRS